MTPERLAHANHLEPGSALQLGQRLVLPIPAADLGAFTTLRMVYWRDRFDRYRHAEAILGVHGRVVSAGETASSIARLAGMPLWTLAVVNPQANLDQLKEGDTLLVPHGVAVCCGSEGDGGPAVQIVIGPGDGVKIDRVDDCTYRDHL